MHQSHLLAAKSAGHLVLFIALEKNLYVTIISEFMEKMFQAAQLTHEKTHRRQKCERCSQILYGQYFILGAFGSWMF